MFGERILRTEVRRLLTVGGTLVDDLPLDGVPWAGLVRSQFALGRLVGVDVVDASALPGVVQNAVVDALAHLGVRHVDILATPEKVGRAIAGAAGPAFVGRAS